MRRAFTLTELLTVIGILALLAAITFPVFAQARKRGRLVECGERLHQVALGLQMYRVDNDEQLWQTYTGVGVNASTAGAIGRPWAGWLPAEPYLKSPRVAQCPEPHFADGSSDALFNLRTINRPEIANERTVTVWHAFVPEAGRVVATCGNHVTAELERPFPALASYRELHKGTYLVVREDGSTSRVPSGQIGFEYLGLDGRWRSEPGSGVSSQAWRFPNEPWPPITPNLWAPFGP